MRPQMFLLLLSLPALLTAEAPIASQVTEVTLFADRALITRHADIELPAGVQDLSLVPLPAWVNPASIRARLLPGGDVLDVRTQRDYLIRTPDEEIQAAENALQEISDRIALQEDHLKALEAKRTQIQGVRNFATTQLPADAQRRDIPVDYFREIAEYLHQSQMEIDAQRREIDQVLRELRPEHTVRRRQLQDLQQGKRLEQLHLTFTVKPDQPGPHTLQVTYESPGASWEPFHEIRIRDGAEVSLVSLARIRQTTGEDWENVQLAFSTRRPGQQARVPQLEALLVGQRGSVNPLTLSHETDLAAWNRANDVYMANNMNFNPVLFKGGVDTERFAGNIRQQVAIQARAETVFTKLEARGTTARYEAEGKFTVRSDGAEVRVPFAALRQSGDLLILAAPEISPNAARGIELTYNLSTPLLPGEAALFVDGAFIGNTALDFAGPGERFVLFAGTEDALRITRTLNPSESELRRGRRTNRMGIFYVIEVENTGDRPLPLRLADRIPVSDDRDIRVEQVRIEPSVQPDDEGLFHWETTIPPKTTRSFTLRYLVTYPADLRMPPPRSRATESFQLQQAPGSATGTATPDSAAAQILRLERMF